MNRIRRLHLILGGSHRKRTVIDTEADTYLRAMLVELWPGIESLSGDTFWEISLVTGTR